MESTRREDGLFVEFENKFYDIIFNSKYKSLLLGDEKITVNYQTVNEILFFMVQVAVDVDEGGVDEDDTEGERGGEGEGADAV